MAYGKIEIIDVETVGVLNKTDAEELRVTIKDITGPKGTRRVLDIRPFVTTHKYTGWSPKGVVLEVAEFERLVAMADRIKAALAKGTSAR